MMLLLAGCCALLLPLLLRGVLAAGWLCAAVLCLNYGLLLLYCMYVVRNTIFMIIRDLLLLLSALDYFLTVSSSYC